MRSAGTRRALTRSRRRRQRRRAAPAGRVQPGPARARGAWCRRRVHSRISSRHSALVAPPPAARGALNRGGAERERPGEGASQPASPSPHRLRRALPAPLWEGPAAGPTPSQVSAHLEPRPLRHRGRNTRDPGSGEGWGSGDLGGAASEMPPHPGGMHGCAISAPTGIVGNGAICQGCKAKVRGRRDPAGRVQLSLPRDSKGLRGPAQSPSPTAGEIHTHWLGGLLDTGQHTEGTCS